jgi:pyruvate-formate lyase-activating enzyme
MLPVYTGLGCPHRCSFCFEPYTARHYRSKSPGRIIDECEYLVKKHNIHHIYFRNDNFFVNKNEVLEFLALKIERGLSFTWDAQLRANYFNHRYINDEFMVKLKRAGMGKMMIGAESGSPRVLEILKKDITVEQVLHSAGMAYKHSLEVQYPFIIGTPGETADDLVKTMELIRKLQEVNPFVRTAFFLFRPYPGSELYNECLRQGMKEPKSLEAWSDPAIYDNIDNMPWMNNKDFSQRVNARRFPPLKFSFFQVTSIWFHYVVLDNLDTKGKIEKEDLILALRDNYGYSRERFTAVIDDLVGCGWLEEHRERIEITGMGLNRLRKLEENLNHEIHFLRNWYEVDIGLRDNVEKTFASVDRSSAIVVWGAGIYGGQILKTLKRNRFTNTKVVDINRELWGSRVLDHDVFSPVQVFKLPPEYVIISSRSFYREIEETLISQYSVCKDKIINPFTKGGAPPTH